MYKAQDRNLIANKQSYDKELKAPKTKTTVYKAHHRNCKLKNHETQPKPQSISCPHEG